MCVSLRTVLSSCSSEICWTASYLQPNGGFGGVGGQCGWSSPACCKLESETIFKNCYYQWRMLWYFQDQVFLMSFDLQIDLCVSYMKNIFPIYQGVWQLCVCVCAFPLLYQRSLNNRSTRRVVELSFYEKIWRAWSTEIYVYIYIYICMCVLEQPCSTTNMWRHLEARWHRMLQPKKLCAYACNVT